MKIFQLSIDTGGTFTDCIATDESEQEYRCKVLSNSTLRGVFGETINPKKIKIHQSWGITRDILIDYTLRILGTDFETIITNFDFEKSIISVKDNLPEIKTGTGFEITAHEEAPILGARIITQTALHEDFPNLSMKLGSTKGTNALLEQKGAKTLFLVTKGFKDLLVIGNQARPDIFALNIIKPKPLHDFVIEIDEQIDAKGNILKGLDFEEIAQEIQNINIQNTTNFSVALCLKNAYINPSHEKQLADFLRETYPFVSVSTELSPQIKMVNRAETAVVNAYLSPIIHQYLQNIAQKLPESSLQIMTSAGSLVHYEGFQPKDSLFSGPAGGVVGASVVGTQSGFERLLTFDMGGTSTDVARYEGVFDYQFSQKIGNAHIFSPSLAIETVAAGGGSICYFDGFKLSVGPESAGSNPGPACYGAGGPLTITDVNLLLGRLDASQFGIPIFPEKAKERIEELCKQIEEKKGVKTSKEDVLEGFRAIANEKMAGAIRQISVAKGYDTTEYALLSFGGAGGLHACGIAELLNIKTILLPKDAGLLSAYGISKAKIEKFAEKSVLQIFDYRQINKIEKELEIKVFQKFIQEGFEKEKIETKRTILFLRLKGQDSSIEVDSKNIDSQLITVIFKQKYIQIYGHFTENRAIEVESIRVIGGLKEENKAFKNKSEKKQTYQPEPNHFIESFVKNSWQQVPVYFRDTLNIGARINGFALILDKYSTTVVEEDFVAELDEFGTIHLIPQPPLPWRRASNNSPSPRERGLGDEVSQLELFTNRFMSIAEQMGVMLQRTSLSVNVKERLDFSCALLDAKGELIANAPHIPVHLGSLGICVRSLIKHIEMNVGDVVITNHPKYGGSHLPDITLVSPVYAIDNQLIGYVVNRCHHAEIGGIRPASMPPNAKNLAEEGVVIPPIYLVKAGNLCWDKITDLLQNASYPTRAIAENLADLNAALASNRAGEQALKALVSNHGLKKVHYYMDLLKTYSAKKMEETIFAIPSGVYSAEEFLDDNSPLKVKITIKDSACEIDFTGSAGVHSGNLNANEAIVNSVVIYVLRLLLNQPIPLNDGLLRPVQLIIPENSILKPHFPDNPAECPAVVGGNVELSQRLTDTLLKAFGIVACSQGTMNNTLFGNNEFGYYETICGGSGAGEGFHGTSGVHTHMTNTRITDPEIMELRYPVRLEKFQIRENSGGKGQFDGGNGIEREIVFLEKVELSLLSQHRKYAPFGINGGEDGALGEQQIIRKNGEVEILKGIDGATLDAGDRLVIKTPGGGGFGVSE